MAKRCPAESAVLLAEAFLRQGGEIGDTRSDLERVYDLRTESEGQRDERQEKRKADFSAALFPPRLGMFVLLEHSELLSGTRFHENASRAGTIKVLLYATRQMVRVFQGYKYCARNFGFNEKFFGGSFSCYNL